MTFDLGDYVEVDERIRLFYERYPEGRIATIGKPEVVTVGDKTFIACSAAAWKKPGDEPSVGNAWEPFPGTTSYTKNSEAMNAETSAWGRALVAAGILAKGEKVASRNEVRNRSAEKNAATREENQGAGTMPAPTSRPDSGASSPASTPREVAERMRQFVKANGYAPEDAVCPSCGKKEALGGRDGAMFCASAKGGCGWPKGKGQKGTPISYGEYLERQDAVDSGVLEQATNAAPVNPGQPYDQRAALKAERGAAWRTQGARP